MTCKCKCIHAQIFICPASLCILLVGAFNPFTLKVIIDMHDLTTIILIILGVLSVGLFLLLCFLPREVPLAFAVKLVLNSFNFCLSGKLLISPSNLNKSLPWKSFFGCRFFLFITLNISCHFFLSCRVSFKKSAYNLMGLPLYIIIFPLLLLIFYLCL